MTNTDAIKWLKNLSNDLGAPQHECLWHYEQAIDEICKLLEEQEPVKPELRMSKHGFRQWLVCGACGSEISTTTSKANYCPYCGRKVKWECRWNRNGDERNENC